MRSASAAVGPGADVSFFPGWLYKLGAYYGLRPRDTACEGGEAWVFFGIDRDVGKAAAAVDHLAEVAARCDASLDRDAWGRLLETMPGPAARVTRGGAAELVPASGAPARQGAVSARIRDRSP